MTSRSTPWPCRGAGVTRFTKYCCRGGYSGRGGTGRADDAFAPPPSVPLSSLLVSGGGTVTFYVYVDNSNLWIEAMPVSAVRKDMAKDA